MPGFDQESSQQEYQSISTSQNFSQILEEKNEESPPGKTDQSMKSNSKASINEFKIHTRTCSREDLILKSNSKVADQSS